MTVKLSPMWNDPWVDASGNPLSGYQLFTYANNSSTKQSTYTSSTGLVAQANPIVLNAGGYPTNPIWLTAGLSYTFVLASPTDSDPPVGTVVTRNDITGINDSTGTVDQWIASQLTPTYISATSFSFAGDQTTTFTAGRRLKTTNSGGTIYSTIVSSVFGAVTTITVVNDTGSLDSGLSAVSYGIISSTNTSLPGVNIYSPNFLLNPGINVAQRLTSFDSTTNPANSDDNYLFDQWILLSDGNDIVDISRTAQGSANVANGASFGLLSDIETANKKFAHIQILSAEKTKALWKNATGKVSAAVSIICSNTASFANMRMYVLAWTGTADSVTSDIISAWGAGSTEPTLIANLTMESNTSITPTTGLVRTEAANISLDTAGTNNLIFVILNNDDSTTITHTMTLSAPKLEPGTVCTPYQERPYEEELDDCQFYFWRQTRLATSDLIGNGHVSSTTNAVMNIKFPRPMRITPTGSVSAVGDFLVYYQASTTDTTGISGAGTNLNSAIINAQTGAVLTAGDGCTFLFDGTAGGYIQYSAEL